MQRIGLLSGSRTAGNDLSAASVGLSVEESLAIPGREFMLGASQSSRGIASATTSTSADQTRLAIDRMIVREVRLRLIVCVSALVSVTSALVGFLFTNESFVCVAAGYG